MLDVVVMGGPVADLVTVEGREDAAQVGRAKVSVSFFDTGGTTAETERCWVVAGVDVPETGEPGDTGDAVDESGFLLTTISVASEFFSSVIRSV